MQAMRVHLLSLLLVAFGFPSGTLAGNLLVNGDFSASTAMGTPAGWSVVKGQKIAIDLTGAPPGVAQALRIDVVADGGTSYGQVYQNVPAKPGTLYRMDGKTRSSKPQLAFLSVKLLKGRSELQRIGLPKSQVQWTTVSHEFSSGQADTIQVLCRWEQNAKRGWVGTTAWFAELKLVEAGPAPPPPPWQQAIRQAAELQPAVPPARPLKPADADIFVTPNGEGRRDGTSWQDALPGNAPGVLQAAWDAMRPGHACRLGSGIYAKAAIAIASGGTGPDRMKRLVGEDTGGGLPWLVGDWQPQEPAHGLTCVALKDAASYFALENLRLARYQFAIQSSKGQHVGLRMRNLGIYEGRYGIYLNGLAYADAPDAASHEILIEDCQFIHFTKNGVRMQGGNYDVKIVGCTADAGGEDWMKESFQICYDLAGDSPRRQWSKDPKPWAGEHDVLFINCVARNAIYSQARYWQGDGFCAENDVRNLAFINCASFDNADGGWDVKAKNVVYVNCIGMRNKMNWRVWQHGFFYNCLNAYSFKRGGSWTGSGMWALGEARADHCTFHNNESRNISADAKSGSDTAPAAEARVSLHRCIVSCDWLNSATEELYGGDSRITAVDTARWQGKTAKGTGDGLDPQYVAAAASKAWAGQPADAFDSRRYGPAQGFHSSVSATWRAKSTPQLIEAAETLLKHHGWEDFVARVQRLAGEMRDEGREMRDGR